MPLHSPMALFALIRLAFLPKRMALALSPVSQKHGDSNALHAADGDAFSLAVL
jgi:hypothetical protein